jgi:hypothetical protein
VHGIQYLFDAICVYQRHGKTGNGTGRQEGLCDCKGHASGDQDSLHPCAARMAQRRWETEAVARTGHGPAKPLDSPDMLVSIRAPALARGAGGGALPTAHITVRVSRREALPLGAADMIW